ncbi:tRNA wybutosine-synthesizing protein 4 [Eucyclogobius newberryi]|uniref:tRNA wybutosine-synthesizing protein 4 n=1 Tax=Eucyclogobius newberryi TaxID=166745 RepID=UPI003B59F4EF
MPVTNKKKLGRDTAVQGTNDSSVVSKVSAAAQGYFQDVYLQHFVCKESRRAPLINRGYYVRWRAVDHCVRRFLEKTSNCPKRQILSLGAGFDSLYFRLHSSGVLTNAVVFEVDFPDVARRKSALINSNNTLKEMLDSDGQCLTEPLYFSSSQYLLLGVDVRELPQMGKALDLAGFVWTAPTLILSEVVLTYMETKWSDSVIKWTADHLPQSLFVIYEQIHPFNPFGRIMQEHFRKLNSTLYALQKYPDAEAQRRRFLDNGWEQCVCLDMNSFYFGLVPEVERLKIENLEPFDEYEEWHQKCSHYFILTASRGSLTAHDILSQPLSPLTVTGPSYSPISLPVRTVSICTEGLGMGSVSLCPNAVLLTGGSSKGGREAQMGLLLENKHSWKCIKVASSGDLGVRLYHTVSAIPEKAAIVLGGRTSPLNPVKSICKLTIDPSCTLDLEGQDNVKFDVEQIVCDGGPSVSRWRHTTTLVSHKGKTHFYFIYFMLFMFFFLSSDVTFFIAGKDFLFVFGGKNETQVIVGEGSFMDISQYLWTEVPVEGAAPEARFSHTACSYQGGVVIFGGLGKRGVPLGDTTLLRATNSGFRWQSLDIKPTPVARYSHCAHVIGDKLLVVGGVWFCSHVPGVAVINLSTQSSMEYHLDVTSVPWPLMLHSFCSELTDSKKELLLIGGGGNCFSFGTHLNQQPAVVDLRLIDWDNK